MSVPTPPVQRRRRWWRIALWSVLAGILLFVVNGLLLARGERPQSGTVAALIPAVETPPEGSSGRPAILAGDFNAQPDDASMRAVIDSGRFVGALQGERTWPADRPRMRIDYVFAPAGWKLVEHRVLDDQTSDHRPVISVFRVLP